MAFNANMTKIGKRKQPGGAKQPEWLWPRPEQTPATPQPSIPAQSKRATKKQEKQLAEDLLKRRDAGELAKVSPPAQLVGLVGDFLADSGFTKASKTLAAENKNTGAVSKDIPSLITIYTEWHQFKDGQSLAPTKDTTKKVKTEIKEGKSESKGTSGSDVEMADIVGASGRKLLEKFHRSSSNILSKAPVTSTKKQKARKPSPSPSNSSDSDADEENEVSVKMLPKPKVNNLKRKAESSSSDSSSSDSYSGDSAPKSKKLKTKQTPSSRGSSSDSGSTSSSDSSSSSSEDEKKVKKARKSYKSSKTSSSMSSSSSSDSSSSSESESAKSASSDFPSSSSDSDSDSSSASSTKIKSKRSNSSSSSGDSSSSDSSSDSSDSDSSTQSLANKTPLPDSDSDSSSSDSDSVIDDAKKPSSESSATLPKMSPSDSSSSDSAPSDKESRATITAAARRMIAKDLGLKLSKDTDGDSASLDKDLRRSRISSSENAIIKDVSTTGRQLSPPLPPDPIIKSTKKTNTPFSRISKDQKVDERLASNAFVPYDYAQKAHEDLIVTRGKGFTKEKNKKKRGSYRGGYIDVEGKKGIKFDD